MSFTLTMSGVIVGRSELEVRDPDRKVARGAFRPGLGYELAQPVFELYDAAGGDQGAIARYRQARDALKLQLADASGRALSMRDIHIRKGTPQGGQPTIVMEVQTDDPAIWSA
jgi:hypothetical protein